MQVASCFWPKTATNLMFGSRFTFLYMERLLKGWVMTRAGQGARQPLSEGARYRIAAACPCVLWAQRGDGFSGDAAFRNVRCFQELMT